MEISILTRLGNKEAKDEDLVEEASKNQKSLALLLHGVSSVNPTVKYRSAKVLKLMSERHPEALYS